MHLPFKLRESGGISKPFCEWIAIYFELCYLKQRNANILKQLVLEQQGEISANFFPKQM